MKGKREPSRNCWGELIQDNLDYMEYMSYTYSRRWNGCRTKVG